MPECSLLEGKTKEESKAICLNPPSPNCLLDSGKSYRIKPCPHCGGRLEWDREDKEWRCLNCARSLTPETVETQVVPQSHREVLPKVKRKAANPSVMNTTPTPITDVDDSISKYITRLHKLRKAPPRETPKIYKGHGIEGAWWPPGEITFRRRQMLFLIKNLPELREGDWPANPVGSGYVDLPLVRKGKARSRKAYFEIPTTIAAEVEVRLEKCGVDGLLLEAIECWGKSEESLAKYLGIPLWSVRKRANNALRYITGWERKEPSYKEFLHHRKAQGRS